MTWLFVLLTLGTSNLTAAGNQQNRTVGQFFPYILGKLIASIAGLVRNLTSIRPLAHHKDHYPQKILFGNCSSTLPPELITPSIGV
jgi:hypothetical protein